MSTGNFEGLGKLRQEELRTACAILGIEPKDVFIVDHTDLQDGPHAQWPPQLIALIVAAQASKVKADMIITFDAQGVSHHPNHIAVWRGAVSYLQKANDSTAANSLSSVVVYALQSSSMWRKFCGPLDIPLSLCQTKLGKVQACYISKQPLTAIQALKAHKSQYVWYRMLYIRISRYTYVNTLIRL
ncbi:hypothetical protein WJX79_004581 [Trebouxia sp. C0005]